MRLAGNTLRAAVLGANDGLVSNLALVMGVSGAGLDHTTIIITGLAGLLAGAGSMSMGEWISVQSAHEQAARYGIEADEGSPWAAALASFFLFALGAFIPMISFIFQQGAFISILVSAVALFSLGVGITTFTSRNKVFSGFRQLLIGLSATALTYGLGTLLGVTIH